MKADTVSTPPKSLPAPVGHPHTSVSPTPISPLSQGRSLLSHSFNMLPPVSELFYAIDRNIFALAKRAPGTRARGCQFGQQTRQRIVRLQFADKSGVALAPLFAVFSLPHEGRVKDNIRASKSGGPRMYEANGELRQSPAVQTPESKFAQTYWGKH